MPEWISDVYDYLDGVQFHPAVTAVIVILYIVIKYRWEIPYIQLAKQAVDDASKATPDIAAQLMQSKIIYQTKASKVEQYAMIVAFIVSLIGEFALYWPKSGQAIAICAFMSLAQTGAAWFLYYCIDKWGLMDRVGKFLNKKIDDKLGASNGQG